MKMRLTDIPIRSLIVHDFDSNYLDLAFKSGHETDSVSGHEKRGMTLKQRCAGVVK